MRSFMNHVTQYVIKDLIGRIVVCLRSISRDASPSDIQTAIDAALGGHSREDLTIRQNNELGIVIQKIIELSSYKGEPEREDRDSDFAQFMPKDYSDTYVEEILHETAMRMAQAISTPLYFMRENITSETDLLVSKMTLEESSLMEQKAEDAYTIHPWTMGGLLHLNNQSFTAAAAAICGEKANCLLPGKKIYAYHIPSIINAITYDREWSASEEEVAAIAAAANSANADGRYSAADISAYVSFVTNSSVYSLAIHTAVMALTEGNDLGDLMRSSDQLSIYADLTNTLTRNIGDIPEHLDERLGNRLSAVMDTLLLLHGAMIVFGATTLENTLILYTAEKPIVGAENQTKHNDWVVYVHPINYNKFTEAGNEQQTIINYARYMRNDGLPYYRDGASLNSVVSTCSWVSDRIAGMNEKIARQDRYAADDAKRLALTKILNARNAEYRSSNMTEEEQNVRHEQALITATTLVTRPGYPLSRVITEYIIDMMNNRIITMLYRAIRIDIDSGMQGNIPVASPCSPSSDRPMIFGVSKVIIDWLISA